MTISDLGRRYVRTRELAEVTKVARSTWEKRRLTGDGPPFIRVGRAVLYDLDTVMGWLAERQHTSTSDLGRA